MEGFISWIWRYNEFDYVQLDAVLPPSAYVFVQGSVLSQTWVWEDVNFRESSCFAREMT